MSSVGFEYEEPRPPRVVERPAKSKAGGAAAAVAVAAAAARTVDLRSPRDMRDGGLKTFTAATKLLQYTEDAEYTQIQNVGTVAIYLKFGSNGSDVSASNYDAVIGSGNANDDGTGGSYSRVRVPGGKAVGFEVWAAPASGTGRVVVQRY